ncbi:MAG: GNAT family N-acetyltransferase [Allosphingosinicella sp.]
MEFDAQPVLKGERVTLRPLAPGDWDALYAVASDRLIWEQHPAPDRWQEPVFRAFFEEALATRGALLALDSRDGEVIGSSRFHGHDPVRRDVEIGWTFLARSRWGGIYNGEIKRLMLDHAFRFVDSVVFMVGPANIRSQTAVKKLGAVPDGRAKRFGRENLVFRLDAGAWATQSLSPAVG